MRDWKRWESCSKRGFSGDSEFSERDMDARDFRFSGVIICSRDFRFSGDSRGAGGRLWSMVL